MKHIVFALAGSAHASAELYAKKCASCHGKDGKPTAVGQKMGAHDLGATKLSEVELVTVITNGKNKMTAYKDKLTEAEIQSLAKYVKGGLK
jgi:cytochrome c6